ncbi:alpha/beta fold hydrolase [Pseudomonas typographi]|uniref:alpha/beta fold hydrolase n=1 Tax=Pseudomonas typographi TaxID=2715964 RepID=UPI001687EDDB|nr:alpha/beta fold hydrolase [Pseudomonas typographi]MBD1552180.1 alpha/beta fold hydrolase [Pseudomonas typographi]
MGEPLYLLPGWGLSVQLLGPLAEALHPAFEVTPLALPALPTFEGCLQALHARIPEGAWLAGWSLGGMLAVALAAQRGSACPGVVSLASNACFTAREQWPAAMPAATFDAFLAGCRQSPAATLKRFSLLCSQGSEQARELARQLVAAPAEVTADGLALLAGLDNRQALAAFPGPQLHLLGAADALVPAAAYPALAALAPRAQVVLLDRACHAFPVQAPRGVAQHILDWMHSHG